MVSTREQTKKQHERALQLIYARGIQTQQTGHKLAEMRVDTSIVFPPVIDEMFRTANDPSMSASLVPTDNGDGGFRWTLLSLNNIDTIYESRRRHNSLCRNVDIAHLYHGMGHYVVCTLNQPTGQLYYRLDGGSDGYAAEYNARFATRHEAKESELFDVQDWIADVYNETTGKDLKRLVCAP